jgi:hypothetical protein
MGMGMGMGMRDGMGGKKSSFTILIVAVQLVPVEPKL